MKRRGFAQALLRVVPTLHIAATSREALGVDGEVSYRVPSLSLPASDQQTDADIAESEAVRLFIERARAVVPDFELNGRNAAAIAEICRRLDGIPLALELGLRDSLRFPSTSWHSVCTIAFAC